MLKWWGVVPFSSAYSLMTLPSGTAQWSLYLPHCGHCLYRTVVTVCTAQWSLYVPHSGHCMYRTVVTICTAQWSLYVSHFGHYMYRTVVTVFTALWSPYVPHCGHCIYRTVVTICTRSLTFSNSTCCPHSVFMCFVWISEQTAIISLYSIDWLVCITKTVCVYCAVRNEALMYNSDIFSSSKCSKASGKCNYHCHLQGYDSCSLPVKLVHRVAPFSTNLALRRLLNHYVQTWGVANCGLHIPGGGALRNTRSNGTCLNFALKLLPTSVLRIYVVKAEISNWHSTSLLCSNCEWKCTKVSRDNTFIKITIYIYIYVCVCVCVCVLYV